jgi:hypothetical protein
VSKAQPRILAVNLVLPTTANYLSPLCLCFLICETLMTILSILSMGGGCILLSKHTEGASFTLGPILTLRILNSGICTRLLLPSSIVQMRKLSPERVCHSSGR